MSFKTNLSRFAAVAAAAAAAFVSVGASASSINFDPTGGGGAVVSTPIDSLDWLPDNALSIGALSSTATAAGQLAGERYFQTVSQGKLASFHSTVFGDVSVLPSGFPPSLPFGREFTFQTSFFEFGSAIGTSVASFRLAPGANYFRIFADTTPDANATTGTGYGDGTLILEGTLTKVSGTFNTKTFEAGNADFGNVSALDGFGSDEQSGVQSVIGQGSNKVTIDVTYLNSAYFADNIAQLVLTMDYFDTTNLNAPFLTVNPSDQVVGVTPSYSLVSGTKINGMPCSTAGGATEAGDVSGRCDFHFQSDASSSFVAAQVPEPGSLALIGIALGGLGFAARRKRG